MFQIDNIAAGYFFPEMIKQLLYFLYTKHYMMFRISDKAISEQSSEWVPEFFGSWELLN